MKNKKPEIYICMYVLKHAIEATHRYIDRQTDRQTDMCPSAYGSTINPWRLPIIVGMRKCCCLILKLSFANKQKEDDDVVIVVIGLGFFRYGYGYTYILLSAGFVLLSCRTMYASYGLDKIRRLPAAFGNNKQSADIPPHGCGKNWYFCDTLGRPPEIVLPTFTQNAHRKYRLILSKFQALTAVGKLRDISFGMLACNS